MPYQRHYPAPPTTTAPQHDKPGTAARLPNGGRPPINTMSYVRRWRGYMEEDKARKKAFRVLVAGTGFLADSYDLFVINICLLMMKELDYIHPLTRNTQANISIMAVVGAMVGQFVFGVMGDRFGRKSMFMFCALLTVAGNLMQMLVQPHPHFSIWQQLMVARFVMGVGVGGEYPMAATITAEVSEPDVRGRNLATVFSMQGLGRVLCALTLVFSVHVIKSPDLRWRFAMGMGIIPMLIASFFRWLPETELYEEEVKRRIPPGKRLGNIVKTVYANRFKLLGTAGSWFILDVLFYGNSLFSADVTRAMGTENTLEDKVLQNLYVQLLAFPGYLCAICLIDVMGRKYMQMFGFVGEMAIFTIMAAFQPKLRAMPMFFVFLYAATFFFDDCGPNTTTFVIPAEVFPTEARSTCHGISAAFGKAGAALGGFLFLRVSNMFCPQNHCTRDAPIELVDKGLRLVFWCCAALALVGVVWTWGFVNDEPHPSLERHTDYYSDSDEDEEVEKTWRKKDKGLGLIGEDEKSPDPIVTAPEPTSRK